MERLPLSHEALHSAEPAGSVAAAITRLRALDHRVTAPRRAVIEILARRPDHLTIEEIALAVGGDEAHRATIYRTVEVLAEAGVLSTFRDANSPARFHLASLDDDSRHLHARCRACGRVVALPVDVLADVADRAAAATGFVVDVQNSVLIGQCGNCPCEPGIRGASTPG
jgi:Fur family ferric uptake transcriptional regulator